MASKQLCGNRIWFLLRSFLRPRPVPFVLPVSLALLLTACGGGGGSASVGVPASDIVIATQAPVAFGDVPPTPEPINSSEPLGRWSPLYDWPLVAINLHLIPDGRVLSWGNEAVDVHEWGMSGRAYITEIPTDRAPLRPFEVSNSTTNLFCSGSAFLPDGRLLVAGGERPDGNGSADTNIFDFRTLQWQKAGSMNAGRWYPTATTLANGDILTLGGTIDFVDSNLLPQVWNESSGWRDLSTATRYVALYPRMHLAPNGKVLKTFDEYYLTSDYLDTRGTGSWSYLATLNHNRPRDYGTSVIYDDGRILAVGGGEPPTNTAETINLNAASPRWEMTSSMAYARRHLNATIMADGKVLVTGGSASPGNDATLAALPAETWDPQTGQWTTMASMNVPRVYHSTALLLPDGRVLAAGGGAPAPVNGVDNRNAEIYSPPYLFAGPRPEVTSAPGSVRYGEQFKVGTPHAARIVKATWISLSSVTHAFNMSQRISHLPVVASADGITVRAPADANLSPPGHYMLFLIDANGVPSIAKIIRIS